MASAHCSSHVPDIALYIPPRRGPPQANSKPPVLGTDTSRSISKRRRRPLRHASSLSRLNTTRQTETQLLCIALSHLLVPYEYTGPKFQPRNLLPSNKCESRRQWSEASRLSLDAATFAVAKLSRPLNTTSLDLCPGGCFNDYSSPDL